MRKFAILLSFLLISCVSFSQAQPAVIDSFKRKLETVTTAEEKIEVLGYLSRVLMNVNPAEADKYAAQLIQTAEATRDRRWMIKALLINGERYSYLSGRRENIQKSIGCYEQALSLARQHKLDTFITSAYLALSEIHRLIPDTEKALNFSNQAFSYASLLKSDSLLAKVHLELGSVYLNRSEKLLALRNYFSALRISEEIKNSFLLRLAYMRLVSFYISIEDYDRAIDFQVKAMQQLDFIKSGQTPYSRVQDLNKIGELYAAKKNYDMSMHYYEKSLALADSLKFDPLKVLSYRSIVNNYLSADEPRKALQYFNEHPQFKNFLTSLNFGYFVDQSYGFIYTKLGNYDSAKYYYNKIAPYFEKDVNTSNQYSYNYQLGMLYQKTGEYDKSLHHYSLANNLAVKMGDLQQMKNATEMLDSLYRRTGNYKQALYYSSLHYQYKDSLAKLGKEKDLMQAEAVDEQQRQQRIENELAEKKRQRNNIQYLAITIGIVALFLGLVVLGMFKVSATTIKMIGFFAFLMFFEFIFLIFKKNIYSITKGEPWKDLLFMIGLAALLLPLHHWLEHKVIHYLTSHNRLTSAGHHIRKKLFRRTKTGQD